MPNMSIEGSMNFRNISSAMTESISRPPAQSF